MIELCDLLLQHASDRAVLEQDPVVQGAAQRWLEVLGEAASHVSSELRDAHPDVPWREIIGTRVILAHAYFHIEQDIIGRVIEHDIPGLRGNLRDIVEGLGPDGLR